MCDLVKNLKKGQSYFVKKREREVQHVKAQVAIAGIVKIAINSRQSIWSAK